MSFRLRHCFLLLFLAIGFCSNTNGQETFPTNGPRNTVHNTYIFTHANIVVSPGEILKDVDLVVRNERIEFVGKLSEFPSNAVIRDLDGYWIYPSFIELDSDYGMPGRNKNAGNSSGRRFRAPQINSNTKGAYAWNEAIRPENRAADDFHVNPSASGNLRSMGYGMVLTHKHDGIMRGTSALVFTGTESDNLSLYKTDVANHLSFSKGSSGQDYPSSLMGSIALLRQTYYDARWYETSQEKLELNLSLEAINRNAALPTIFEADDHLSALRADKIMDEFEFPVIIRGSGDEYRRLDEIKRTGAGFIIPLKLPEPYDLSNSYDLADIPLHVLKHWEMAPFNGRYLKEKKVQFAYSSSGLDEKSFWESIRALIKTGLDEEDLLASLTTIPAAMIGCDDQLGSIKEGYTANFLITTNPIFEKNSEIVENWVNGKQYIIKDFLVDIRGTYNLNVNKNGGWTLLVEGTPRNPKGKIEQGKEDIPVQIKLVKHEIELRFRDKEGYFLLSGQVNDDHSRIWVGKVQLPDGSWSDWAAIKQSDFIETVDSTAESNDSVPLPLLTYPLMAYGWDTLPKEKAVLFRYATLWTNEDTGIIVNADICIQKGKIVAIGKGLTKASIFGTKEVKLEIINAKDKHITSGIIDEHSHIAISRGVNEGGQASSAEVRIGDVVNSDDINIYRQLSGGVTCSQLLHGSANPIGGQSALIKLRWGLAPEDMKIKGADGFIKFALGENVKQSNWGDFQRVRYPQTRMGVEQVFYDHFIRAQEYGEIWQIYRAGEQKNNRKKNQPIEPRRDLELDALLEILDSNRFITCHSYVQSEINMLMHVADSMGFRVNTFTHILEGYKVADKMKRHGVGASSFSDWWAYKFEVNDAIPYNASLLNEQGIVTAINSDDAEMGRRLNQEAAKSVKYGGTSQEDAWKMVTLNPAKLLHLDDRMGSLKVGKDADLVVWSDNPLSINARAEQTYVDGRLYYDSKRDIVLRKKLGDERNRLIQKMISETSKGKGAKKYKAKEAKEYHCDTMEDEWHEDF